MATVGSFLTALARRTLPDRAAGWDSVGLQFGDPDRGVERVAVCHEVTEEVVEDLLGDRPDLVLTYHPLLFRPTSRLVAGATPGGRAWRLITAGVALAVTHTDFDAVGGGTADALAAELGMTDVGPFGPLQPAGQVKFVTFVPADDVDSVVAAMTEAGGGRIGNYDACSFRVAGHGTFMAGEGSSPTVGERGRLSVEPEVRVEMLASASGEGAVAAALVGSHPYEEPAFDVYDVRSNQGMIGRVGRWEGSLADLRDLVAERLGDFGLRVSGPPETSVEKIAVVPGSGASFAAAAAGAGADALVTGDLDHHRAREALDAGLAVVDPGHAATELPGMRRLVEAVGELGVEAIDLVGDGSGPWTRHLLDQVP